MTDFPATILGGLPVIADISSGYDSFNCEHWSEVNRIYWRKHDGSRGKEIPQHLRDRAEKYDYGFCGLIENAYESAAAEREEEAPGQAFEFALPGPLVQWAAQ